MVLVFVQISLFSVCEKYKKQQYILKQLELFNKNQLHSFLNSTEFAYAVVSQQGRLFSSNSRFAEVFG